MADAIEIESDVLAETAETVTSPPPEVATLTLRLEVTDPDVLAELGRHPAGRDRDAVALAALRIGVLALRHARGTVDADVVRSEGERLLAALRASLEAHGAEVRSGIEARLREYFDPSTGRFSERVERLVRSDGELEQLLRRQIGQEDSELARTLARHVGESSPLMQVLSPDESCGLLQALGQAVAASLDQQRERILGEFSLDRKESALSRLVAELTANHGELSEKLRGHIQDVVGEFDLNREESALSRLVRRVEEAQKQMTDEFSLDREASALARLRRELLAVLEAQRKVSSEFQAEVRATLTAMQARRAEAQRSTRHGNDFEAAVVTFLEGEAQRLGDVLQATGTTTGLVKNCKVGDAVVTIGPEAAAAGARIVIEAKENAACGVADARAELETARKNRGAPVGVFVFSRRVAPPGLEPLVRYGDDVLATWDHEDPGTDVHLRCAFSVARALCTRAAAESASQRADFEAIERAIRAVEKQAAALDEVATWAGTVQSSGQKIQNKALIMQKELGRQVAELDARIRDLRGAEG